MLVQNQKRINVILFMTFDLNQLSKTKTYIHHRHCHYHSPSHYHHNHYCHNPHCCKFCQKVILPFYKDLSSNTFLVDHSQFFLFHSRLSFRILYRSLRPWNGMIAEYPPTALQSVLVSLLAQGQSNTISLSAVLPPPQH